MSGTQLFQFLVAIALMVLWWIVLYFVVKAATTASTAPLRQQQNQLITVATGQADLLMRLVKHLAAQSDLMLVQARHDGITDEQLAAVLAQIAERRADPALNMPFQ